MGARKILAATALTFGLALVTACGPGRSGNAASAAPAAAASPAALASSAASVPPAASSAGASSADIDSARAFLVKMYASYGGQGDAATATHPNDYFDASLAAMMALDNKRGIEGYETALDYDPVCDCQDSSDLRPAIVVTRATATSANALVTLSYLTAPPPDGWTKITIDLVKTSGGWRIHDIHAPDVPSLRGLLQKTNRTGTKIAD